MSPRAHQVGKKVPAYPGRKTLEAVLGPLVEPVAKRHAGRTIQRLLGFWALWQVYGDLEGLISAGLISRAGVYAQRNEFREMFGIDVADWLPDLGGELFSSGAAVKISGADAAKHRRPQQTQVVVGE